ncbi:MAG: hypothetical protein V4473_00475 [Patescibacteria group bacterium]
MTATSSLATLFSLSLNRDLSLAIILNPIAILIVVLICVIFFTIRWYFWRGNNFVIDTAEMGIGSHKISFKPNIRDQEIAYKIWVELSTRKIGLPIDLEHDVISEIYDSWFNFFSITRELIKDIPVNKVKNQSTRKIITLSISVLNEGLRPHLTTWQARFRRWYDRQLANATDDADPQAIQEKYPKFSELKTDLIAVNKRLIKYREKMREVVLGIPEVENKVPPLSEPVL